METTEIVKFEKPQTDENVWVLAFDTLCIGWDATKNENDEICLFTEEEINQELEELEGPYPDEYFKIHMDEYIHGRKCFINFDNNKVKGYISGIKPKIQ